MAKKSIITQYPITAQTPPSTDLPRPVWDVGKFDSLIYNNGYQAYIDRALRCPCVDRSTGQALSTCSNCLGRGWFFVDRRETKVVAQSMANIRRNSDTGEINRGTARITARAVDRLGFMDRVILLELVAYFTEVLRPIYYNEELVAFPIYEPLEITNMYLYIGDTVKLQPLSEDMYKIKGNRIVFSDDIADLIDVSDVNQKQPDISISVRYSYNPCYHVLDANRELTRVREKNCVFSNDQLRDIPINVLARKAHYIFDNQIYGRELLDNTVTK